MQANLKTDNLFVWNQVHSIESNQIQQFDMANNRYVWQVHPLHHIERCTQLFGPIGVGWGYALLEESIITASANELFQIKIQFWVRLPIHRPWLLRWLPSPTQSCQVMGSAPIAHKEGNFTQVKSTYFQEALYQAIDTALSLLGFGAEFRVNPTQLVPDQPKVEGVTSLKPIEPPPKSIPEETKPEAFDPDDPSKPISSLWALAYKGSSVFEDQFTRLWEERWKSTYSEDARFEILTVRKSIQRCFHLISPEITPSSDKSGFELMIQIAWYFNDKEYAGAKEFVDTHLADIDQSRYSQTIRAFPEKLREAAPAIKVA